MKLLIKIGRTFLFFIAAALYSYLSFILAAYFFSWGSETPLFDIEGVEEGGIFFSLILWGCMAWWLSRLILSISPFEVIAKWGLIILIWIGGINMLSGIWLVKHDLIPTIIFSLYCLVIIATTTSAAYSYEN